jgi:murein DD-endopeptidase MepM/ murein hydrolase activator NlpD
MFTKNKNCFLIIFSVMFFCGVLFFYWHSWVSADTSSSLQDQLDAIKAKIKAYNQIINLKQRQGITLTDQIQSLEDQAAKLELEIELNKKKIDDLQGSISSLSLRIAEKESLINSQRQMLAELMRAYYSDYSGGTATLLLSSNETTSYLNQESWSTQMNDKLSDLLNSVTTLRESLTGERTALEEKKKIADELHIQLTSRNDYLANTKENKEYLLTKTQTDITKYNNLVDELQKQREEIENEIENLEAGKVDQLSGMPAFKKGLLTYPLKQFTISQGYGKTSFSKTAYKSGKHNGIDFAVATGTPIYAAGSGQVIGVGNLGKYAYGRWVAIDHGNGLITLYGHMNSISVSKGSKVKQGDKIGTVGSTGYSTGSHVHFTVFATGSYEVVPSKTIAGLMIPIGATVNPNVYLP